ncbi:MAG: Lrp/AsnC family transcriptional regulator [Alphaproteobacteria bacterium]|nr:Lrp/AsnC family transcriptional regulator [Alphaproteobacteria bacterium]
MISLDETDRKILRRLQADAGLSVQAVADAVGLSLSPCWRRIKRLREEGAIAGQVTLVDQRAVGLTLTALANVSLTDHHDETVTAFERALAGWEEVLECHAVTGDRDYFLRILAPDMEAYERFLSQKLLKEPCVASVNSRFSLRRVKYTTALPV